MRSKKIYYVEVVRGSGTRRLRSYEKGGGIYRRLDSARSHIQSLKNKGFGVKLYEGDVTWTQVPTADDTEIQESPLP